MRLAFSTQKNLVLLKAYLKSMPEKDHREFNFTMCYYYLFAYLYISFSNIFHDLKRYPNRTSFGTNHRIFDKDVYTTDISKILNDVLYHITDGFLEYRFNNGMVTYFKEPSPSSLSNITRKDINNILDDAMYHLQIISILNWTKRFKPIHKRLKKII